jgi:hypothetical protein
LLGKLKFQVLLPLREERAGGEAKKNRILV